MTELRRIGAGETVTMEIPVERGGRMTLIPEVNAPTQKQRETTQSGACICDEVWHSS